MFSGRLLEAAGNCCPRGMIIAALRGNLGAEQNSAYDLLKHLFIKKKGAALRTAPFFFFPKSMKLICPETSLFP